MVKLETLAGDFFDYNVGDIKKADESGANVIITFQDNTTETLVYTSLTDYEAAFKSGRF